MSLPQLFDAKEILRGCAGGRRRRRPGHEWGDSPGNTSGPESSGKCAKGESTQFEVLTGYAKSDTRAAPRSAASTARPEPPRECQWLSQCRP